MADLAKKVQSTGRDSLGSCCSIDTSLRRRFRHDWAQFVLTTSINDQNSGADAIPWAISCQSYLKHVAPNPRRSRLRARQRFELSLFALRIGNPLPSQVAS